MIFFYYEMKHHVISYGVKKYTNISIWFIYILYIHISLLVPFHSKRYFESIILPEPGFLYGLSQNQGGLSQVLVFPPTTSTDWLPGWKHNRWRNSQKRPIANPDLWKILDLELGKRDIEWKWIRGHNGDPLNEYADRVANEEAANAGFSAAPY